MVNIARCALCMAAFCVQVESFRVKMSKRRDAASKFDSQESVDVFDPNNDVGTSDSMVRRRLIFGRRRIGVTPWPTPSPPIGMLPSPPQPECAVPQWMLDDANKLLNSTLLAYFDETDKTTMNLIDRTGIKVNLGICMLEVDAVTFNNITNLYQGGKIHGLTCKESECIEGPEGDCLKHKVTLGLILDFELILGSGYDESYWKCGYALPVRAFNFTYKIHHTKVYLDIGFELATAGLLGTPQATLLPEVKMKFDVGGMTDHKCYARRRLVKPVLTVFCRPLVGIVGWFFRDIYFPGIAGTINAIANAVLTPKPGQKDGFWSTASLTDNILYAGVAAIGGLVFACICCLYLFVPSAQDPEGDDDVPVVMGDAMGETFETVEPSSAYTLSTEATPPGYRAGESYYQERQ